MSRRLSSVQIQNFKAIKLLEFPVNAFVVITGGNAAGKSSVIAAVLSVLTPRYLHDPSVLHCPVKRAGGAEAIAHPSGSCPQCAKKAIVTFKLEDGTTISRIITEKGSDLKVLTKDGGKVDAEATYVKELVAGMQFNPVAFLKLDGKGRAAELTKAMPITFQGSEVNAAANEAILAESEMIDLKRFTEIRDGRYASRTDVAREQTMAEGFIVSTEAALPQGTQSSWQGIVEMLRGQVSEAKAGLERDKAEIHDKASAAVADLQRNLFEKEEALRVEFEGKKAALRSEYLVEAGVVQAAYDKEVGALQESSSAQLEELTAALGKAEQSLADQNRVEGQRAQLEKMRLTAQGLQKRWNHLDAAVKALDRLKSEKLATLPVPGVEVRLDDKSRPEVYVGGVHWDHVNKAKQCLTAVSVAAQSMGPLPLMLLDDSEGLDGNTLAHLIEAAKEVGLQIITARVETGAELTAVEA